MQDLQTLITRMVEAGESEEDIALVIKHYKAPETPKVESTSFADSVESGSQKATGIGPHKRTWTDTFNDFKEAPLSTISRPITTVVSRNLNKIAEPMMQRAENTPGAIRNDKSTRPEDLIQRSGRAYLPDDLRTGALLQAYGESTDAMTNPLNLGFMGAAATRNAAGAIIPRATTALADKLRGIQSTADTAMKVGAIPVMTGGAQQAYEGETLPDKLLGGLQIGMGALGLRNRQLTQGGVEGYTKPGAPGEKFAGKGSTATKQGRLNAENEIGGPAGKSSPPPSDKPITRTYKNASGETTITAPARNIANAEAAAIKPIPSDFFDRMGPDPNFSGGLGDAELAGSTPYQPTPEPQLQNVANSIGSQVGNRVTVRDPLKVQQFMDMGFNPVSTTERGTVMVRDNPQPTAEYAFDWPEAGGPQYHIRGGEYDKSTVGRQRLEQLGIPFAPPIVDDRNEFVMPPEFGQDIPQINEEVPDLGTTQRFTTPDRQTDVQTGEVIPESPLSEPMLPPARNYPGDEAIDIGELPDTPINLPDEFLTPPPQEPVGVGAQFNDSYNMGQMKGVGESVRNFMADDSGEFRFENEPKGQLAKFPQGGKRQVYDIAEQIFNNPDANLTEQLMADAESIITRERDTVIAEDNFRQLDEYLKYAKMSGDADKIESLGYLRDVAQDQVRMRKGAQIPDIAANEQTSMADYAGKELGDPNLAVDIRSAFDRPSKPNLKLVSDNTIDPNYDPNTDVQFARSEKTRNHPTAQQWQARVDELDARNAPDHQYRDIMSTAGKNTLKRGETWRGRVLQGIDYFESTVKDPNTEPQFARSGKGGLKVGVNIKRSADEVTTGYSQPLAAIMVREGLQNAIDAIRKSPTKEITIRLTTNLPGDGTTEEMISIADTGKGMNRKELETVFSDLHESGKATEAGATGGKGVGKASYMLGGRFFAAETISVNKSGEKIAHGIEGTPDDFMTHVDIEEYKPDSSHGEVSTGTTISVKLDPGKNQTLYHAKDMVRNYTRYSRDLPGTITVLDEGTPFEIFNSDTGGTLVLDKFKFKRMNDDTVLGTENFDGNEVTISIPKGEATSETSYLDMRILNNGQYQYQDTLWLGEKTKELPGNVIVNIKPSADEGTSDYPFPTSRESIKEALKEKIQEFIKQRVVDPLKNIQKSNLRGLYDGMVLIPVKGNRPSVLFDPGQRLTSAERDLIVDGEMGQMLAVEFDSIIKNVLQTLGHQEWISRVEQTGLILDPSLGGIHIPNPDTPMEKSTILINPFGAIGRNFNPSNAAIDIMVTILHEVAHVGTEVPKSSKRFEIDPADLNDPRIGIYLQTYLKETYEQGGLDMGHGMPFVKRLGEIYAQYGSRKAFGDIDGITDILTDPSTGGYRPELQELLRIYSESRRRPETVEDILSGTGEKSANRESSGKGTVPPNSKSDGKGAVRFFLRNPTPEKVKRAIEAGFEFTNKIREDGAWEFRKAKVKKKAPLLESEVPSTPQKPEKVEKEVGLARQIWDASRGLMSIDPPFVTSGAFRQALPWVGTRSWVSAWWKAARAYGSQKYFDKLQADIKHSPLFRERGGETRKRKSFADEVGLRMLDISNARDARLEGLKSNLAERIPIYGPLMVKSSNRAFTAFLNSIRAAEFENFIQLSKIDAENQNNPELDYTRNLPAARQLAEFLNVTTGAATLKGGITNKWEYSLEHSAQKLADVLFSPRLIVARIKMLNPSTYVFGDPRVRKLYMKGMLRAIAGWWGILELMKLYYGDDAEVGTDPQNPDFGKAKVRNTRFDPGGGFLQYLTWAARVKPDFVNIASLRDSETGILPLDMASNWMGVEGGGYTSSISGTNRRFGEGFNPPTETSATISFLAQKLHPAAKLLWDIGSTNERTPVYLGDRLMGMALPMYSQDLAELLTDDPDLIPMSMFFGAVGGGSQTYDGTPIKPQFTPLLGLEDYDIKIGGKK